MNSESLHLRQATMQRSMIGAIALVLLLIAAVLWLGDWGSESKTAFMSACWRIGVVMGLFWLAEPELRRWPAWVMPVVVGALALVIFFARKPMQFLVVVVILIIAAVVRPRGAAARPRR